MTLKPLGDDVNLFLISQVNSLLDIDVYIYFKKILKDPLVGTG